MKHSLLHLGVIASVIITTITLHADVLVLQASEDTVAYSSQPDQNFGSITNLRIAPIGDDDGLFPGTGIKRTFIKFDLTQVPREAVITNVSFRAFQTDGSVHLAPAVFAVTESWSEHELTWGNQPVASLQLGTMTLNVHATSSFTSSSLTGLVRLWHSGTTPAHGLAFRAPGEEFDRNGDTFASRESENYSGPELIVEYSVLPEATLRIRVSEIELCWETTSNAVYQLQYRSALTGDNWLPLGSNITGTGGSFCTNDSVTLSEPKRFYRIQKLDAP